MAVEERDGPVLAALLETTRVAAATLEAALDLLSDRMGSDVEAELQALRELPEGSPRDEDRAITRGRARSLKDNGELIQRAEDAIDRSRSLVAQAEERMRRARTLIQRPPLGLGDRPDPAPVSVVDLRREIDHLRLAVVSRAAVGEAVGVVMVVVACDSGDALTVLTLWSRTTNVKLRTLAEQLTGRAARGEVDRAELLAWHGKALREGRLGRPDPVA